jgi:hypothetical protein
MISQFYFLFLLLVEIAGFYLYTVVKPLLVYDDYVSGKSTEQCF